ncbi:MAG: hypothetical protein IPK03_07150 [Bacteroidetes bacterium]|nr:hypothetical protein [Bacteroidota bacterium]
MKKLGIIMMLALSSLSIKAEDDGVRDHIQYGFKIGANMSNVYSVSGQSFIADPKFGLAVGGSHPFHWGSCLPSTQRFYSRKKDLTQQVFYSGILTPLAID